MSELQNTRESSKGAGDREVNPVRHLLFYVQTFQTAGELFR